MLDTIRPILHRAKSAFPKGVDKTVFEHLMNSRKADESQTVVTMTIGSIVSLNDGSRKGPLLEEALSEKRWWRDRW